jgi:rhodanese-related sulfurtransferase
MSRKHPRSNQPSSVPAAHLKHRSHKRNLAWVWVSIGALAIVVIAILMQSRAAPVAGSLPSPTASSFEISPAEAYLKFQQGAFFLDVRSQGEWNQFHIKGSTLVPLDQLPNRLSEVPKDKDVVVVCLSGHRSQSGTAILQQAGFTHVFCLNGGLQAWMDANYPIERGSP